MVARIDNELLSPTLLTPQPDLSDSDDMLLALETARALEAQGEISEAARWLRRAADEAEQQGDDERYLVLARAAAEMVNIVGSSPPPPAADAPTLPPPSPDVLEASAPFEASDAQLEASDAHPTTPPPESFEPTIPPPASAAPTLPPPFPASATISTPPPATISSPPDMPFAERSMRIGAIRVAILEASIRGAKSFFVERLERGQLPPAGSTEAMLVFTGEAEGDAGQNVDLLAASDSIMP
jgi:hypothetical protein